MLTRILKWTLIAVVILAAAGFGGFLYFIPPLTSLPPDDFIKAAAAGPPAVDGIADPAERLLAERGRYLVLTADCAGCHTTKGPQGSLPDMFLAGGMTFTTNTHGAVVSRNLTPDRETGLASRSDEDIQRVLRSGMFHTGRPISARAMPWSDYSNWNDEDLHAVVVFLRHLKPVRHQIPDPAPGRADAIVPGAAEVVFAADAGKK